MRNNLGLFSIHQGFFFFFFFFFFFSFSYL